MIVGRMPNLPVIGLEKDLNITYYFHIPYPFTKILKEFLAMLEEYSGVRLGCVLCNVLTF